MVACRPDIIVVSDKYRPDISVVSYKYIHTWELTVLHESNLSKSRTYNQNKNCNTGSMGLRFQLAAIEYRCTCYANRR